MKKNEKDLNNSKELSVVENKENDIFVAEVIEEATITQLTDLENTFKEDIENIKAEIAEIDSLYKQIKEDYDIACNFKNKKTDLNAGNYDSKTKIKINSFISKQTENLISLKQLKLSLLQHHYMINKNKSELNLKQYMALLKSGKDKTSKDQKVIMELLKTIMKGNKIGEFSSNLNKSIKTNFDNLLDQRIEEENIHHDLEYEEKEKPRNKKKFKIVYIENKNKIAAVDKNYNILKNIDTSNIKIIKIDDSYYNEETGEEIEVVIEE